MRTRFILFLASLLIVFFSVSCKQENTVNKAYTKNVSLIRYTTDSILNNWHEAAGEANFEKYFKLMSSDAVFIGTDASEHWNVGAFKAFSKPYFDKGQAWDFKPLDRHVFISENQEVVWFDELLDTWMGVCRGSGVLKRENDQWKIAHYVLSATVPNDDINSIIEIKKEADSLTVERLKLEAK